MIRLAGVIALAACSSDPVAPRLKQVLLDVNGHISIMGMNQEDVFDAPGVIATVRRLVPDAVVAPVNLSEAAIAASDGRTSPALVKGVGADAGRIRTDMNRYIVGTTAAAEAGEIPLLVGEGLARALGVTVGAPVSVVWPRSHREGSPRSTRARITALLRLGVEDYDQRLAVTTVSGAPQAGDGVIEIVEVQLADPDDATRLVGKLRFELGRDYLITGWCELNREAFEQLGIPCR